jgi:PSP1 C-terminal conserved region
LYGRQHSNQHSDEDLSHPLVGENIEVPGEEQYFMNEGLSVYQRSASMGHVMSYGVDSLHLPTAGASIPMPKIVYNVKFKRTQRTFEIGPRLNRDLKVGTYVKVEADRGEDLGIVVGKVKNTVSRSTSFGGGYGENGNPPGPTSGDSKKIIRLATHDEVNLLHMKREEEEELLKICRTKARQRGLPMNVVDAEYQFDRHKLTFFFEAEGRVDFRELVRDLFSMYKTRIWMQQLDKNTSATCPAAPTPAPLVMDYGTPIIAPASEYQEFAGTSDEGCD